MGIEYYLYNFARLHTAKYKGKQAPHKAVLLIAVMRLIARGTICSTEIELTDELVSEFKEVWMEKLPASCPFSCNIGQPFYHMQHEKFWRLIEHDEEYSMLAEELKLYNDQAKDLPKGYSVNAIRQKFRCAIIDKDLFYGLRNYNNLKVLEDILTTKYLTYEQPLEHLKKLSSVIIAALFYVA